MRPTDTVYSELQAAYDVFNAELFQGQLPACLITLQRRDSRSFGYFSSRRFGARVDGVGETDEIALNPLKFKSHGPREALQTLAHEMCHLWQHHCGKPSRKAYHNHEWANKMESIGLMPSDTGAPGGKRVGQSMADYVIEGGPFEAVANRLLAGDFRLAWYDRAEELIAEQTLGQVAVAMLSAPGEAAAAVATATASRAKHKFVCGHQGCKAKAWGKQTLHIVCGEHGQRMEVASK